MGKRLVLLCLCVVLAGCKTVTLVQDLSQERATSIVATLSGSGISATVNRGTGAGGKYAVQVEQPDYESAMRTLQTSGILQEPDVTVEELTAASGIIPASRDTENLRLDFALGLEVSKLLESHPGVRRARVIVRSRSLPKGGLASATVLVQAAEEHSVYGDELRDMVLHAIPGLADRDLLVKIVPDPLKGLSAANSVKGTPSAELEGHSALLFGFRVAQEDHAGLAMLVLGAVLSAVLVGVLSGYVFGVMWRHRRGNGADPVDNGARSSRIDRQRDLLEV